MKWLKQLTDTIDYLHLELGICHNDLQIKNIMIDRPTDKLLLAGFELTCPVSDYGMQYELNQVTWLLYALVTHDFTNAETHFLAEEQLCDTKDFEYEVFGNFYSDVHDTAEWYNSTRSIDEIPEWPVRVQLDCECYELRQYVKSWIQRRKSISIPTPKTSLSFDIRKFDFSEASVSVKMEELEEWQMDEDTEPTNFNQCNVKAYPDPVGKASDSLITVDPMEWDLVSDSDSEINFPVHLKRTAGDDDEEPPTQKRTRMSSPEEDPVECLCQHLARDSLIEDIEFDADMAFIVYGQECPVHEEEWRAKYSGDNVDFRQ
ncbi:hypothetical protein GGS21DRAFT_501823 [Xylaria nigripes]|nr:hypothetical protein GGS21DRAFT_501823 [Xylaria nigripes]